MKNSAYSFMNIISKIYLMGIQSYGELLFASQCFFMENPD